VYVDSRQRLSGTDGNFSYNFNLPADMVFNRVVLMRAEIPKSYYLVQASLNTFTLTENGVSATVTVPIGDYLLTTFQAVLPPLLNAVSPNGWTYSMTYPNINTSANTGKYTWSVTGNGGLQPSFTFTANFFEPFGFNPSSTNTFIGNSLTSANVVKLQVEDRIFIHSNIVEGRGIQDQNVLADINAISSPDYSTIIYECYAPQYSSKRFKGNAGNTYNFSISDEAGTLLNTNGLNIQLTVLLYYESDIVEKVGELIESFKSFLKDYQKN
jgi:hypothetical protein